MNKDDHSAKSVSKTQPKGEAERDNDAQRPDGSTGTTHDSTAQKTARGHQPHQDSGSDR